MVTIMLSSCRRESFIDGRTGIKVLFYPEYNMFPADWYTGEVKARVKALSLSEIKRSTSTILKAMNKYPISILTDNISRIYILQNMNFYGVNYAGTYDDNIVFLVNNGRENGYSDRFMEQSFHHEFSSVLYWNYIDYFDRKAWLAAHEGSDSIYFDELGGAGAMISGQDSDSFDPWYHEKGFLYEYATSSFENDFNSFAENIFCPEPGFWEAVDKYERLNKKIKIIVDFYHSIDPTFTESYFRNMDNN
ncbi:MAG: hypothetical protein ABIJ16_06810 [Bacteroidota bacterium]